MIRRTVVIGMTLIEVLITVMIMAIAVAITVPSILDMRRSGAESKAAASLKGELLPACLQFQQMYDATRDVDGDQLGDFPMHPACLCGGQAGMNAEVATTGTALTTDLVDRQVWSNALGADYTSQGVNLRLANGTLLTPIYKGAMVGGYQFGFLTGGTPDMFATANYSGSAYESSLRDVMITVFATPTDASSGHRRFAMGINPFYPRGMLVQTTQPLQMYEMAKHAGTFPTKGVFYCPAGLPLDAVASPATGGVAIPGNIRLNAAVASPMP